MSTEWPAWHRASWMADLVGSALGKAAEHAAASDADPADAGGHRTNRHFGKYSRREEWKQFADELQKQSRYVPALWAMMIPLISQLKEILWKADEWQPLPIPPDDASKLRWKRFNNRGEQLGRWNEEALRLGTQLVELARAVTDFPVLTGIGNITPKMQTFLVGLYRAQATQADPLPLRKLVARAKMKRLSNRDDPIAMSALKRLGLVAATEGKMGGYYLTPEGYAYAKSPS